MAQSSVLALLLSSGCCDEPRAPFVVRGVRAARSRDPPFGGGGRRAVVVGVVEHAQLARRRDTL